MNRIVALTPADADNGFACCGAAQHAVTPGSAAKTLMQALIEAGSGVVILDERLVEEVGEDLLYSLEQRWPGVLVVLPAPGVVGGGEDYAMRLIRMAVGYQVKVKR
jgi:vacuolar-type H+-ATPase subunit F/Vma7